MMYLREISTSLANIRNSLVGVSGAVAVLWEVYGARG